MKLLVPLAVAATLVSSAAFAAPVMEQGTKDRMQAYVRVNVAWFTNEACMFVSESDRNAFLDNVAGNVIGLREELGAFVSSPTTAKAFLYMLQGQAIKLYETNYTECGPDAETAVHEGILEAAAINDSIARHGPYVDPREHTETPQIR